MKGFTWRQILRENFTSTSALADFLELVEADREKILQAPRFILNLPRRLAEKIRKRDLSDPLLRQFVPLREEETKNPLFVLDPVGDLESQCSPNLLHKYEGRALLLMTSACAMHCRYCFRKNYPYDSKDKSYLSEIELLKNDPSIEELILSGGDPLSLSNEVLEELFKELEQISHLKRLRIHTRFPVGIPERIDEGFIALLRKLSLQCWFVVHINHPNELSEDLFVGLQKIQKLGIPVLTQAVLLKGVNDNKDVLKSLYSELSNKGIFAYYLHQLDRVEGTVHFEVEESRGLDLIAALQKELPGYAVPKYVKEIAGFPSKMPI